MGALLKKVHVKRSIFRILGDAIFDQGIYNLINILIESISPYLLKLFHIPLGFRPGLRDLDLDLVLRLYFVLLLLRFENLFSLCKAKCIIIKKWVYYNSVVAVQTCTVMGFDSNGVCK